MGFRTIDLDTKEGQDKYKKLKETNSVQETFGSEGIEKFAPRLEGLKQEEVVIDEKIDAPVEKVGTVKGVSQLRVREKPEGEILYLISEKSVVKILEEHDVWLKVETAPGRQGFVMRQFIEIRTEGG